MKIACAIAIAVGLVMGTMHTSAQTATHPHLMVIIEENHEYSSILGNPAAPYINLLAKSYALATASYAVSHPSLPNYLALTSGSTQGVTSNCTTCGPFSGPDLPGELSAAGVPWRAYMESMPSACFSGAWGPNQLYAKKHDPFLYYSDVLASGCANDVVPFTQSSFGNDLKSTTPPSFVWVTPNQCNDMHSCAIGTADAWLARTLAVVFASSWYAADGTIVITWDEGGTRNGFNGTYGGHVMTLVVSASSRGRFMTGLNHYGVLRAIEEAYGVPLTGLSANAGNGDLNPPL